MVTKLSKVKNVFGESHKLYFEDIKPVEVSSDGQLLDINTHFAAVIYLFIQGFMGKYWRRFSCHLGRS
jgi:hypothetical protein